MSVIWFNRELKEIVVIIILINLIVNKFGV